MCYHRDFLYKIHLIENIDKSKKNDSNIDIKYYQYKMFVISGEIYEDEEIIFPSNEDNDEENNYEPIIDTYTMLSFIIQERFNASTVCF